MHTEQITSSISCDTCTGACCSHMMHFGLTDKELVKFGSSVCQVDSLNLSEISTEGYRNRSGVYFAREYNGSITVYINGVCPNLNFDNTCTIYSQRPQTCSTFKLGGNNCLQLRQSRLFIPKEKGLPLIPRLINHLHRKHPVAA